MVLVCARSGVGWFLRDFLCCAECVFQVMYLAANMLTARLPSSKRVLVTFPHGAEGGFDPYQRWQNINEENYYEYLHGAILTPEEGDWVTTRMHGAYTSV